MKVLTPYFQTCDARGSFQGIINSGSWEELNYLETRAGEVRGGHYHKDTRELFYIIDGEIELLIEDCNRTLLQSLTVGRGSIFIIEPFEIHTFTCRTDCRWINVLSKRLDNQSQDIHKL